MTDTQKMKRNFRGRKVWKLKKLREKKRAGGKDEITLKPLRKGWQLHHEDLREENYTLMNDNFVCLNNKTHDFIHWLWTYWKDDREIIGRIERELKRMEEKSGCIQEAL